MDLKGQKEKNPLDYRAWKLANTLSSQGAPCALCGSYEDVQVQMLHKLHMLHMLHKLHVRAFKDRSS